MSIVSRTATVVENSAANSITGSLPSDRVTGDIVIAAFIFTTTAAISGPAGWSQLVAPFNNGVETMAVYYRVSPPAAPTASYTGTADNCSVICQAYGNVDATTPLDVTPATGSQSGAVSSIALPSVTIATAGARFISVFGGDTTSRAPVIPSGMTLVKAYSAASNGRLLGMADEVRASTGATGTRTWSMNPTGTVPLLGVDFALSPTTGLALSGSVTATGFVRRNVTKNAFTASITPSGVFSKLKVVFRVFDGSSAPTGVIVKSWRKIYTGAIPAAGVVRKLLGRTFVSTITATGFFRKAFVRRFTGAIATTGNVVITFLGRAFGRPGRAALTIQKAGEVRIRVRRK